MDRVQRLVFANNAHRTQAVAVNGRELDRFVLEDWSVTERWLEVPGESVADGQLKIEVSATPGKTTTLCELWLLETRAGAATSAQP